MKRAIGIDVGGTKIAAGLIDLESGVVLERREKPTGPARGGEAILQDVVSLVNELRSDATAIGVGIAELVDREGKIVSNATIDWLKTPAREQLSKILPTLFEADVRAAARAEAKFGAGTGAEAFLYVTVGTGISGCLMIEGQPYLGARGLTGTFASARSLAPLLDYRLNPTLVLEEFSSGPALVKRYVYRVHEEIDAREVCARAKAGEPTAREIVETGGRALGAAIAQLVNTLDPEAVVIGGGLGCAGGVFHAAVKAAFYEHLWSKLHADVPIHLAKLGPDAGIVGAALAAAF
jgi:predicted NBD/HSP70 family sugar kinase